MAEMETKEPWKCICGQMNHGHYIFCQKCANYPPSNDTINNERFAREIQQRIIQDVVAEQARNGDNNNNNHNQRNSNKRTKGKGKTKRSILSDMDIILDAQSVNPRARRKVQGSNNKNKNKDENKNDAQNDDKDQISAGSFNELHFKLIGIIERFKANIKGVNKYTTFQAHVMKLYVDLDGIFGTPKGYMPGLPTSKPSKKYDAFETDLMQKIFDSKSDKTDPTLTRQEVVYMQAETLLQCENGKEYVRGWPALRGKWRESYKPSGKVSKNKKKADNNKEKDGNDKEEADNDQEHQEEKMEIENDKTDNDQNDNDQISDQNDNEPVQE